VIFVILDEEERDFINGIKMYYAFSRSLKHKKCRLDWKVNEEFGHKITVVVGNFDSRESDTGLLMAIHLAFRELGLNKYYVM
jgi:hypothetical protein